MVPLTDSERGDNTDSPKRVLVGSIELNNYRWTCPFPKGCVMTRLQRGKSLLHPTIPQEEEIRRRSHTHHLKVLPVRSRTYATYVPGLLALSPNKYHRQELLSETFLRLYFAVLFLISKIGSNENKENNLIKQILQNYNKQI